MLGQLQAIRMPSTQTTPPTSLSAMQAGLRHALDAASWARGVLGFEPDPWQEAVLQSTAPQIAICCSRQSGKSTVAAIAALHAAEFRPGATALMVAPTQRQSTELLAKASTFLRRLPGAKLDAESTIAIRFASGSRLVSLPGTDADRIRGFSAPALVILDEAAFIDDRLYFSLRPMLAVGGGRLLAMSTPNGKRGWFYESWHFDPEGDWQREQITAMACPRIAPSFLEKERRRIGDRWFRQEYLCEFISSDEELFDGDDIEAAFDVNIAPLSLAVGL